MLGFICSIFTLVLLNALGRGIWEKTVCEVSYLLINFTGVMFVQVNSPINWGFLFFSCFSLSFFFFLITVAHWDGIDLPPSPTVVESHGEGNANRRNAIGYVLDEW